MHQIEFVYRGGTYILDDGVIESEHAIVLPSVGEHLTLAGKGEFRVIVRNYPYRFGGDSFSETFQVVCEPVVEVA
jgi:hypothetical protein